MVRQEFGRRLPNLRKSLFQDACDAVVKEAAPAFQQRLICGIANEGVLKDIVRVRCHPAPINHFRFHQLGETLIEHRFVHKRHRPDQFVGELSPEGRADLRNFARAGKPIEPRRQRILQSRRNRGFLQRTGQPVFTSLLADHARFEDHTQQLLDKQRHAVRLRRDVLDNLGRQRLAAQPPRYQFLDMWPAKAGQRQLANIGSCRPSGPKIWTERQQQHQLHGGNLLDQQRQQIDQGRVRPMQVLDNHQDRLPLGFFQQPRCHCVGGLSLDLLGAQFQRRQSAVGDWNGQQGREQRYRCFVGEAETSQHAFQLDQLRFGRVFALEVEQCLQIGDNRVQGTIGKVGQTAKCQVLASLGGDLIAQYADQAGLADARFAREQHHLTGTVRAPCPAIGQELDLGAAPHERGSDARRYHPGLLLVFAHADNAERGDGLRTAFQFERPALLEGKGVSDQALRRGGDEQ